MGKAGKLGGKAVLTYVFWPESEVVNRGKEFHIRAQMVMGESRGCLGIANQSGNPGNMILYIHGRYYKVPPGYVAYGCTGSPVPPGYEFELNGGVSFDAGGEYRITILAGIE